MNSLLSGIPIPAFLLAPSREIQHIAHTALWCPFCHLATFHVPPKCSACIFPASLSMFWPHPIDTSHELHADKTASFPHHFLIKLSDTGWEQEGIAVLLTSELELKHHQQILPGSTKPTLGNDWEPTPTTAAPKGRIQPAKILHWWDPLSPTAYKKFCFWLLPEPI